MADVLASNSNVKQTEPTCAASSLRPNSASAETGQHYKFNEPIRILFAPKPCYDIALY
ncbi:MAG: hypothetical protein H7245_05865 [Candidatus Saccharibacteria bacterium]|nr:hypothetical protein [Pseudorhodobacter sp.]